MTYWLDRKPPLESQSVSQRSVLQCPTPKTGVLFVSKSLEGREVVRVQCQPAVKEENTETSDESGPPLVPMSARVMCGRRHHRLRMLVDHFDVSTCKVGFENVEIDAALAAYSNDCFVQGVHHHRGSQLLAAVMDRWPSCSRFRSRKLPRFLRCWKEWRPLTPARTRRAMLVPEWEGISVHPHFAGNLHSVRASGIEKEGSCPTACATSPMLVDRGIRDGSVLIDQRWLQWVNKLLPALKAGNHWNLGQLAAANMFLSATDTIGTQQHDYVPNMSQLSQHRSGFRTLHKVGIAFSSVASYDKSSRLTADLRNVPRCCRQRQLQIQRRTDV